MEMIVLSSLIWFCRVVVRFDAKDMKVEATSCSELHRVLSRSFVVVFDHAKSTARIARSAMTTKDATCHRSAVPVHFSNQQCCGPQYQYAGYVVGPRGAPVASMLS
jgi:hypothetical protein